MALTIPEFRRALVQPDKLKALTRIELPVGRKRVAKVGGRYTAKTSKGKTVVFMLLTAEDSPVIAYQIQDEFAVKFIRYPLLSIFEGMKLNGLTISTLKELPAVPSDQKRLLTLWGQLKALKQTDLSAQTSNTIYTRWPRIVNGLIQYVTNKEPKLDWLIDTAIAVKTAYHGGKKESFLSDDQYDELKEIVLKRDPSNKALHSVGAPVKGKGKVELPYAMPSLDKVKPDGKTLATWVGVAKDTEYVVMDKLDGISLQPGYDGVLDEAYTRGDGFIGKDVLRHAQQMSIPQKVPAKYSKTHLNIRAEAYLTETDFQRLRKTVLKDEKTGAQFKNARNMVAGLLNRTVSDVRVLKALKVTAYAILSAEGTMNKKDQLEALKAMGFDVVPYKVLTAKQVSDSILTKHLETRRSKADYAMDGLVIEVNSAKIRKKMGLDRNGYPKYGKAFKTGDGDKVQSPVVRIEYRMSKDQFLKPRVWIEPVEVGGVTVEHPTGFNAAFIVANKLGPGAIVELTRAGDVIPHITAVIKKAKKAQLPDEKEFGKLGVDYDWNATKVDFVMTAERGTHDAAIIKTTTAFFRAIGVDGVAGGVITQLHNEGYTSIEDILSMSKKEMLAVPGFQKAKADNLYNGIREALTDIYLPRLAAATPFFGRNFGQSRLQSIYEEYGADMLNWTGTLRSVAEEISGLSGFSLDSAKQFVAGIKPFKAFLKKFKWITIAEEEEPEGTEFDGISFCFTGVRDKDLEAQIEAHSGTIAGSVRKGLTYLVVKDLSFHSSKTDKAARLRVNIIDIDSVPALLEQLMRGGAAKGKKPEPKPKPEVKPPTSKPKPPRDLLIGDRVDTTPSAITEEDIPEIEEAAPGQAKVLRKNIVSSINNLVSDPKIQRLLTAGIKSQKGIFILDPRKPGKYGGNIDGYVAAVRLDLQHLYVNADYINLLYSKHRGVVLHELTHIVLNDQELERDYTKHMLSNLRLVPGINFNSQIFKDWATMYQKRFVQSTNPEHQRRLYNSIYTIFRRTFGIDKMDEDEKHDFLYAFSTVKEALAMNFEFGAVGRKLGGSAELEKFLAKMYEWIYKRITTNMEISSKAA